MAQQRGRSHQHRGAAWPGCQTLGRVRSSLQAGTLVLGVTKYTGEEGSSACDRLGVASESSRGRGISM